MHLADLLTFSHDDETSPQPQATCYLELLGPGTAPLRPPRGAIATHHHPLPAVSPASLLTLSPCPLFSYHLPAAGAFTNQIQKGFEEPRLLIVTDPRTDHQSIKEAAYMNIPVIAICDTDSDLAVSWRR